jgi:integrase
MKLKLDTKTVAGLALTDGRDEDIAWDADLEGFGLRLRRGAGGERRTYVVQYRAQGRTRRITLGPIERLPLAQAREGARKLLARVSLGEDPQDDKAAQRLIAERTFRKVVDAYLASKQGELRASSFKISKLYLTGPYFQALHGSPLGAITKADVAARLSAISRAHSATTAGAARRAISALFTWAMQEGWCDANPVIGTRKPVDPRPRDRVLADQELVAIWNACRDDDYGRIARLLILLAGRRQEIGGMCWGEFDLDAGTWTLPAERAKNHRALTLPLPPAACAIIGPPLTGERDHVFGLRANGFTAWDDGKVAIDRRLNGTVKPWRLHDLRRTAATRMADIGIAPHIIEAVLNHHSGHRAGVAGIYNRSSYEREVKAALLRWSEHVLALVEGRKSNVVALHA